VYVAQATHPKMGLGLFARKTLVVRRDLPLAIGHRRRISTTVYCKLLNQQHTCFVYDHESSHVYWVDGPIVLANHACAPNVSLEFETNVVALRLTKAVIARGQELFVDYGPQFWQDRDESCCCVDCK